jgi:hypothetical protein
VKFRYTGVAGNYDPFRVWLRTSQDITGEHSTYISPEEMRDADGTGWFVPDATHIPLPLDPAQFDAAGVEAMIEALDMALWDPEVTSEEAMRAALAAYARTVAGGGND